MLKNDDFHQNIITKKTSKVSMKLEKEKHNEEAKKIVVMHNTKMKLSKNESFNSNSNSKSLNDKDYFKKKLLTFESAFNKNAKTNGNPVVVPQILPSPVVLPNSINFNDFSNKVPINININNFNINNFNFIKNERREVPPSLNYNKKILSQNNVLNNFINNNSSGSENNNNNIYINKNYKNENPLSSLKVLNNSNELKSKNKYFLSNHIITLVDSSNGRFIINKNIKNHEFRQINKENIKIKLHSDEKKALTGIKESHISDDEKKETFKERLISDKNNSKIRKEKINVYKNNCKIKTYSEDQNDSLIEELADFLNNENPSKTKRETKIIEKNENSIEENNYLDYAVIDTDHIIPEENKITRNQAQKNFLEINEKQIISSSTNNLNNNNNIKNHEDVEEGPPINYEHFQQVNSKRPQTSYGGISARQKSLQNSLRQMSSKNEEKKENFINDNNKVSYINPFGMKNKLKQLKYLFNN